MGYYADQELLSKESRYELKPYHTNTTAAGRQKPPYTRTYKEVQTETKKSNLKKQNLKKQNLKKQNTKKQNNLIMGTRLNNSILFAENIFLKVKS